MKLLLLLVSCVTLAMMNFIMGVSISSTSGKGIEAYRTPAALPISKENVQVSLQVVPWETAFNDSSTNSSSKYAYAYVIGGCNPNKPERYLGFLYNILISARILREEGSTADIVAFFQISHEATDMETLPDEDVRLLSALGVQIRYIPKSPIESFYDIVLSKFEILGMTEYKRVLLMDGDVMPLTNLDFMFDLSSKGILKDNVVISGMWEPANAGFFMVAPVPGDLERIHEIIKRRALEAKDLKGRKFDEVKGWGHVITPDDKWVARKEQGTLWNFHFAFSDQGLCKCIVS
jgi:hypothetical protein